MVFLSRILYGFLLRATLFVLEIVGWFNPYIKNWIKGRKYSYRSIQQYNSINDEEWVWMHCSSLGEYEQGRPLLEEFRRQEPEKKIIVTFFSSSGYNQIKKDSVVDRVEYLPFDFRSKVKVFIDNFKPSVGVFVKYDLWPEVILYASKNGVRLYLISAVFNSSKWFLSKSSSIFYKAFQEISHIFVQNSISRDVLLTQGYSNVSISGDSRIDRVYALSKTQFSDQRIENWLGNSECIILGSTHSGEDDRVTTSLVNKYRNKFPGKYKFLIFPHLIHTGRLEEITRLFTKVTIYSDVDNYDLDTDVMIVDKIGILSKSYRYSNVVYVGGGFGKSVHNLLEPAVYGNMMICGHKINGFPEAEDFKAFKALSVLNNLDEITEAKIFWEENEKRCAKNLFEKYFSEKTGVSSKIFVMITNGQSSSSVWHI